MIDNFKELTLESEVFDDARAKFNVVLQRLFKAMIDSKSNEGSLTLKFDVDMLTRTIPNTDKDIDSDEREIHVPFFQYKVTSQVAVKDEQKGNNNPEMELVYDADKMAFVLQYIANTEQKTIFDKDFAETEEAITDTNYLIKKED